MCAERKRVEPRCVADLGLPDAEKLTAKVILAKRINDRLESRELPSAGGMLGIPSAENLGDPALTR